MPVNLPPRTTLASSADLLRWQLRWRVIVALLAATVLSTFQVLGSFAGQPAHLAVVLLGYLGVVSAAALRRRTRDGAVGERRAGAAAHATIVADVAALVAATAVATPGTQDWVLVVGFFIVHLAQYSFDRGTALVALVSTAAGYMWLASAGGAGAPDDRAAAAVALLAFTAVAATFLVQYSGRRRRLQRVIALFGRAEEGDFTEAYDVESDRRADAITAVGDAYNRVRARLESLVLTDSLTRCLNRRGFEHALEREMARAERAGSEVALLAVDIDDFKKVNDSFGHVAGDETLHQVGRLLLATARTVDAVGRIGGDEFVILCPDTDIEGARQLAGRLRQQVGDHMFEGSALPVRLTVSVGVAAIRASVGHHIAAELKLRADRALYDAKRAGRNRVRCWELATA